MAGHILYATLKKWLPQLFKSTPKQLEPAVTAFQKENSGDEETATPIGLSSDYSSWDGNYETHYIKALDEQDLTTHTEPFPLHPDFSDPADEEIAMNSHHNQVALLLPPHPTFTPDLSTIDAKAACKVPMGTQTHDISIHKREAIEAMRTALAFTAGKSLSRYCCSHTAFTAPGGGPYSSPIVGEFLQYIGRTHADCPNLIRVAPPLQIFRELKTCLEFAFTEYVTSAFGDEDSEGGTVPEQIVEWFEEGLEGDVTATRDAIDACADGFIEGSERMLDIWEAWMWVLRCYLGILVLQNRRRGEVVCKD
ncbi:hypothetical protein N0V90_005295 [Kalmusia sp. IMI 367209]|nr:hypothetical protein N0V90_005295 [Kalmusia sp. IMI 367209]